MEELVPELAPSGEVGISKKSSSSPHEPHTSEEDTKDPAGPVVAPVGGADWGGPKYKPLQGLQTRSDGRGGWSSNTSLPTSSRL